MQDFSNFIVTVEENHQSYTEEDWINSDQEYEDYIGENYEKFSAEFTDTDKKELFKLKAKYQIIKIKYQYSVNFQAALQP